MDTTAPPLPRSRAHLSSLEALAAEVGAEVRSGDPPRLWAIADALARAVADPDLLRPEHRVSSTDGYRTHVLHVAEDGSFSIVALVWLPGQRTPLHSHRSWCVIGVHTGLERETTYRLAPEQPGRLRRTGAELAGPGQVSWSSSPREIHRVENAGDEPAISIHVYGLDYRTTRSNILDVFDPRTVI